MGWTGATRVTFRIMGFGKCLALAQANCGVTPEEAGAMRAVDSLRDAEQHWFVVVAEQLLYMHAQALVTVGYVLAGQAK